MLKKRIIPCLDIKDGRTVKGINFVGLVEAGDPVELAQRYVEEGADELVFLDITATIENRSTLVHLVERIAAEINIPFTVGGGIRTLEDAAILIQSGADKISINSAAVKNPELITQIAERFGTQCVVLAIDTKNIDNNWTVMVKGGREATDKETVNWATEAQKRGAGEILLTTMEKDGTKSGFALEITEAVSAAVNIPVIASGGAGEVAHFIELFENSTASAALAASVFHFGEIPIPDLKQELINAKIPVRCL